jgi:hypothetical protein
MIKTLTERQPPNILYHGTSGAYVESIEQEGLKPRNYNHVYLTPVLDVAYEYANKHEQKVICVVDAEQLYKDAEKLQENLKKGYKSDIIEDDGDEGVQTPGKDSGPKESYSGASVLRYTLDGRTATHLYIPAYKCYGGGEVTVIIQVNRQGMVLNAQVNENISATDKCLRESALHAARQSRFSKSSTAPERQVGEIVYQFIAQ